MKDVLMVKQEQKQIDDEATTCGNFTGPTVLLSTHFPHNALRVFRTDGHTIVLLRFLPRSARCLTSSHLAFAITRDSFPLDRGLASTIDVILRL